MDKQRIHEELARGPKKAVTVTAEPDRTERGQGKLDASFLAKKPVAFIVGILILIGLYLSSLYHYLLFHSLAEVFSIVVAWSIFIVAWNSRRILDNNYLLFIGIAYLFIGGLDLVHTLGYKGMGIFHGYTTNLPTQLWIATRFMESLSLLIAPLFLSRRLRADLVLLIYTLITLLVLFSMFYWHIFPACFVEGVGLTPFKKISEYIICFILIGAVTILFQKRKEFDEKVFRLLVISIAITIASELCFTFYIHAYGFSNLVGHYFKIISFYLIYKAIVETGLTRPYDLLFRNLKQSEASLRESEKRLRTILDSVPEMVVEVDFDLTVLWANKMAIDLNPGAVGQHCYKAFHGREKACEGCSTTKAFGTKKIETDIICQPLSKKAGESYWEIVAVPLKDSEGQVIKVIEISRNITDRMNAEVERERLETQLRQAQKMEAIGTLTGGIAHDYNNLLAAVLGNISLAKGEVKSDAIALRFLREAEQATLKTRDLTHRLMTLSRGGAPMLKPESVKGLLEQCLRQILEGSKIDINLSIQEDLSPVNHDARQLGYAVQNVLTNAMETMPHGGTLTVKAENMAIEAGDKDPAVPLNEGQYVRISIQDEGTGIPEEIMNRIFDPYFSTKEMGTQKGMGLGLTIAYAIIRNHSGHITVHSAPGEGTLVSMILPALKQVAPEREDLGEASPSLTDRRQHSIKRVLVMDDEEMLRTLAQKMLEHLGCDVETVKDGLEAIETYQRQMDSGEPFDAVILDLTIKGGMGGDLAIRELLKIDPDVKAIVSSGYFNDPVMTNFKAYGFRGALPKPYQMVDLERALRG